jgi:hypothetical protein
LRPAKAKKKLVTPYVNKLAEVVVRAYNPSYLMRPPVRSGNKTLSEK